VCKYGRCSNHCGSHAVRRARTIVRGCGRPTKGAPPTGIALAVWFAARTAPSYLHPMDARLLLDLSRLASDIVAFYKWSVGGGVVVLVVIVLGQGLYDMVRRARRRRPDEARMPNE